MNIRLDYKDGNTFSTLFVPVTKIQGTAIIECCIKPKQCDMICDISQQVHWSSHPIENRDIKYTMLQSIRSFFECSDISIKLEEE